MKAIIPAKSCSTRVPNKNYRPFHGDKSLVDIALEKLLRVLPGDDIYLSCEDVSKGEVAKRHGVRFIARDKRLADNATSMADYVQGIAANVPGADPVVWYQVIDPFFDDLEDVLETWETVKADYDSLVVVHPFKEYVLDSAFQPIGFGFGPWHVTSQQLNPLYRLAFECAVLTRDAIREAGYMVGARPYWMPIPGDSMDIDTEEEFAFAQLLYERRFA